jgi:hypothetical protein
LRLSNVRVNGQVRTETIDRGRPGARPPPLQPGFDEW